MRFPTLSPASLGPFRALLLALLLVLRFTFPVAGQDDDGLRFGITVGGTNFVGFSLEFFHGARSLEVSAGTWAARDLTLSVVGREYFGAGGMKPSLGIGLWTVMAWRGGERPGMAVVARAPVGFDWNPGGEHYLALEVNINRGLWVQRTDPDDEAPMSHRLVPLPGLAYRWRP